MKYVQVLCMGMALAFFGCSEDSEDPVDPKVEVEGVYVVTDVEQDIWAVTN
ncbi:hypothetical protein [Fulvivirga ligni]|uniref:hypothetical protein n=1 Tax=Fulvivirga ligni TaxID=2904246 RepID=UPI001F3C2651|nr:hypothetical protein [Fulvivirga ligni]UII21709.1 hypothetical protein LVD16_00460 [Fulvivirga ligni]